MLNEINIKRKRCKYIRINIKNGEVEVIAPYGSSLKTINDFISSKSDWINKTVNKQKTTILLTKENEKYIYYKGNIIDTDIPAEKAYGKKFGARDIRSVIRPEIEDKIADIIVESAIFQMQKLCGVLVTVLTTYDLIGDCLQSL